MRKNMHIMLSRVRRWYRNIFSIAEIEGSVHLRLAFGAILLSYLATFYRGWGPYAPLTAETYKLNDYVCWPYFPDCGRFYFLHQTPHGYSQHIFFTAILCVMFLTVYRIYRNDWTSAHALLSLLWFFKMVVSFILTYTLAQNYDYFDMLAGAVLLFLPYKFFFLRVMFVLIYFISAALKFDDGWVLGSYFTTLRLGLPFFGKALTPLVTNLVVFMEIVGCWFLFSNKKYLQRGAFIFFLTFHIYSSIIINYRFPLLAIPLVTILFGIDFVPSRIPLTRKSIAGWALLSVFFGIQCIRILIPGDEKVTMEGYRLGIYLFDANHQCRSDMHIQYKTGEVKEVELEYPYAFNRCDPYRNLFWAQQKCKRDPNVDSIAWTFDHSVDGGPFYRIVDEKNACALTYSLFSHNPWIRLPKDNPAVVGYPVQNTYGL